MILSFKFTIVSTLGKEVYHVTASILHKLILRQVYSNHHQGVPSHLYLPSSKHFFLTGKKTVGPMNCAQAKSNCIQNLNGYIVGLL